MTAGDSPLAPPKSDPPLRTLLKTRSQLALENLALRQQLAVLKRQSRPTKNPTWGTPRIQSELQLLGYSIADSTVDKYRIKPKKGPSQTWRTFLRNHMHETIACDFFVVPTATLRLLFGFVVLHHMRREIIHFNVTANPTAEWTALQIQQAIFDEEDIELRLLLRDRDSTKSKIYPPNGVCRKTIRCGNRVYFGPDGIFGGTARATRCATLGRENVRFGVVRLDQRTTGSPHS